MLTLPFSNGKTHKIKDQWEELSSNEYLNMLDYIFMFMAGKISLMELRQMTFFLLSGIRIRLSHKNTDKQSENVYRIAQRMVFMLRVEYENKKAFNKLRKETREKLTRYLPHELDQTSDVRWADKAEKQIVPDLVFAANLIPSIGRRRHILPGYKFQLDDNILTTSLTAAQFIDAQTVAVEIQESGSEKLLNMLVAILYCTKYDPQQAAAVAKQLDWLDLRTKKAIFINFNAIQSYLYTQTKFSLLFSEPSATSKKPKFDLGLNLVAHSLVKTGYTDVDNMNLVKFFEIMFTDMVSGVQALHKQNVALDKIAEQTGLSINKINQIL